MTTRKNKKSNKRFRKTRSKRQRGGGNIPSSTKRNQEEKNVELLLAQDGIDVDMKDEDGFTALIRASVDGFTEIVDKLLEKGADVDAKDNDDNTALIWASWSGHTEIVAMLLDAEADVNAQGDDGYTALYWASRNGHTKIVKLLIRNGATIPDDINNREDLLKIKEKIEREKSHQNLAVIRAAAVQNGKTTMSEAEKQVFSFVRDQPNPGDFLGGKRKTRKNKKSKRKTRKTRRK